MTVLILGATSRIAHQLGYRYAEQGHSICFAARDLNEANVIAADVALRYQTTAIARCFDALDYQEHVGLLAEIEETLGPVTVAILAFGDLGIQDEAQRSFEHARHIIETNFTGAASLAEVISSSMEQRQGGTIIGISSVAGDRGRQSNYFYGSAKGAFTLYLQGLRNRCFDKGVHVMTVRLGFVDTRMTFGMVTGIPIASPQRVSRAIVRAARRRENDVYLPRFWAGIMGVIKTIPEPVFKRLSL